MSRILASIASFLTSAFSSLKPVVGSINGALVPAELTKAATAALGASTVAAGIVAGLTLLAGDTSTIFTSPTIAALATFLLTQAAVQVGQLGHGATVETVSIPEGAKVTLAQRPDPFGFDDPHYCEDDTDAFLGMIRGSDLEFEVKRVGHFEYGPYRIVQTEAGPSGPIFESYSGFESYLAAGRPALPGMPGYRSPGRFKPPFETLPA